MVAKQNDTRLIAMVAQQWFMTDDLNRFCKLIPLAYVDGTLPKTSDFHNDGEIWWMLTARTASMAEPGRVVVLSVENAFRYDPEDPTSSRLQAQRDTVRDLDLKDAVMLADVAGDAFDSIQDVVSGNVRLNLRMKATSPLMLRWRGNLYGPFITMVNSSGDGAAFQEVALSPISADMTVYQIAESELAKLSLHQRLAVKEQVSLSAHRRTESYELAEFRYDLLFAAGYERLLSTNPPKLVLEPVERKLLRYAKLCLTRSKRKQLKDLLEELELQGREATEAEELAAAIKRTKRVAEKQDEALHAVAKAMLESGMLGDDRIALAEQAFAEKYVQERTAELQAKVAQNVSTRSEELRRIESEVKSLQAKLQKEEQLQRAKVEQELAAVRENARNTLQVDRDELTKQKTELERQQRLLQTNLERVTKDLREAGDDVINRYLTIAPLLGLNTLSPVQRSEVPSREDISGTSSSSGLFELPAYVRAAVVSGEELTEEAFFQRFCRVVEDSGFSYRPVDLQRFHLSVKCGEMTILGGPSGTGKSSLPLLYAHALIGEEMAVGRPGCLMVSVNPSWMDTRDLLGHLNTIDGRFYPAESGLFQHLILAFEEHEARRQSAGISLACLDEMNLSQIEHYFGDFMTVLERGAGERWIQCFSPEAARPGSTFQRYGRLNVSPAVRLVGTVNFDETTRLLSDRFLDRVNLIRLAAGPLPSASATTTVAPKVDGRLVTLSDFDAWRSDGALPAEFGTTLDQMRPQLAKLGCPLSPRVYRAICRFVSSSVRLMSVSKAFDLQIAQRVLPKIRGLITRHQLDALDELQRLMTSSSACAFEESIPLLDEIHDTAATRPWGDLEE